MEDPNTGRGMAELCPTCEDEVHQPWCPVPGRERARQRRKTVLYIVAAFVVVYALVMLVYAIFGPAAFQGGGA